MTNPSRKYKHRDIIREDEINRMMKKSEELPSVYFQLRAKALISLAKKFGKRRSEIACLERSDIKVENGKLLVTFTLRKKHHIHVEDYAFLFAHEQSLRFWGVYDLKPTAGGLS